MALIKAGESKTSKFLIIVPLAVVLLLGILSTLGLGQTLTGQLVVIDSNDGTPVLYYDQNGTPIIWSNGTSASIHKVKVFPEQDYAMFLNASYLTGQPLHWDTAGQQHVMWRDFGKTQSSGSEISYTYTSGLGFLALIIGLTAVGAIAGLRIFGSGTSEVAVKMIVLGMGIMALFGVFSFLAGVLLFTSWIGTILYFCLTFMLTLGVILETSGGGSDL